MPTILMAKAKDTTVVRFPDYYNGHPERAKWHIVAPSDGVSLCEMYHTRGALTLAQAESAELSNLNLVKRERVCKWCRKRFMEVLDGNKT